jgi:outer membrane protein assembly factor BamB
VVYTGSNSGIQWAFDAAGSIGCAGSPKLCTPLWSATTGGSVDLGALGSSLAVANGRLYVGAADGKVYSFRPA